MVGRQKLIHDIAHHSAAELSRRVARASAFMSDAELRGYVRAQGLGVVRTRAEQALSAEELSYLQLKGLVEAALERTVYLVTRDLQSPPVVPISTPHVRAAA